MIFLYSKNISDLNVQEMLIELGLPAYDLWKTFSSFINLDPHMPRQLKDHFFDIERQMVLHLIWQRDTFVVKKL